MSEITDIERDQELHDQVELARYRYLLKRIAGWTLADPIPDPLIRGAAAVALTLHGHNPTDPVQKSLDIEL